MKEYIFLGSSVIRLLHAYIGNEAFRRGLSNYLAEYAYQNTVTDKLWSHLSKASNRSNLSDILSTWTKQMGYPLLTVCLFFKYVSDEFV
jgi:aminopeptidase N